MIDVPKLIACGIGPTQARLFAPHLSAAFQRYGIDDAQEQAAFIAQAMHESRSFTAMEEGLYYRDPARICAVWPRRFPTTADASPFARNPQGLANKVYAGRMGNVAPGDGWRYRGRGVFQLTGKDNYRAASDSLGMDFVNSPELVSQPAAASFTAAWFWDARGCGKALRQEGFDRTTALINGGQIGAADRRRHFAECMEALA